MARDKERNQKEARFDAKRDVGGVFLILAALFTLVSLLSYDAYDPALFSFSSSPAVFIRERAANWAGIVGATWADLLARFFGLASYVLPAIMGGVGIRLLVRSGVRAHAALFVGLGGLGVSLSLVLYLVQSALPTPLLGIDIPSGLLGYSLGRLFEQYFNKLGTMLVVVFLTAAALMVNLRFSPSELVRGLLKSLPGWMAGLWAALRSLKGVVKRTSGPTVKMPMELLDQAAPVVVARRPSAAEGPLPLVDDADESGDEDVEESVQAGTGSTRRPRLAAVGKGYETPPVGLLEPPGADAAAVDTKALEVSSKVLEDKLKDFGVNGKVQRVEPGPVVSMFEFEPAPGVKISQIAALADDLALAMRSGNVRIVAPIPGKGVVGIEIPNPGRQMVHLREILESEVFRSSESPMTLALGKDITGEPYVADLAKMPHLLMAGATGAGKSVSLNVMILSMIAKASPDELRLLLVDPKVLEFSCYNGIPHLIAPVVTDAKKAKFALMWAVREMERRYQLLAELGVRNLAAYNSKLKKDGKQLSLEMDGGVAHRPLPYLVVILDELADLMMVASKEVEDSIARLAQMSRAAGIHLIVATQRPSVDVITGMIKANFATRIAFQVTSRIDSRTILDTGGAEQLLGAGDMLYLPPGSAKVARIHGAFVSDKEIKEVVHFLHKQGKPEYVEDVLGPAEGDESFDMDLAEEDTELYARAVQLVKETGYVSVSFIQRRFRIGYNRAARLVEKMEQEGVVAQGQGAQKPWQVKQA